MGGWDGALAGDPGVEIEGLALGEDCDSLVDEGAFAGCVELDEADPVVDGWVEAWTLERNEAGVVARC